MTDELAPRSAQQRSADRLAELLTALAMPIATVRPRVQSDAATPEQVDLVLLLKVLSDELLQFAAEAMIERMPADRWQDLADVLGHAGRLCRHQVVVVPDRAKDIGGPAR